jgi:hypothetical protein
MAIFLDLNQVVSFEELLMSQVVQQEALARLLVEEGVFSREELLEMVKVVNQEMKRQKRGDREITLPSLFIPVKRFLSFEAL